jgi:hypothetical protein
MVDGFDKKGPTAQMNEGGKGRLMVCRDGVDLPLEHAQILGLALGGEQ